MINKMASDKKGKEKKIKCPNCNSTKVINISSEVKSQYLTPKQDRIYRCLNESTVNRRGKIVPCLTEFMFLKKRK